MVEASLATPVLLLFLFGIFEFGFAFRDYLAVANSTRDAAREGSVAGNIADADYRVLRAIERASAALPDGAIDEVIVFKAYGPDPIVPNACLTSGSTGGGIFEDIDQDSVVDDEVFCNVYTPIHFEYDVGEFNCDPSPPTPDPDRFWGPTSAAATGPRQTSVGTGLDYIGIYISVGHDYITGMFGDSITFRDLTVLKVEPQEA